MVRINFVPSFLLRNIFMETAAPDSFFTRVGRFLLTPTVGPFIALLLACIFFSTQTTRFLTTSNFSFIFQQSVLVGVLAIGQTLIMVMVLLYFLIWLILRETAFGRHIYAIGNNREAVRLAGVSTDRLLISVYALAGLFYGLAALLLVARSGVGDPQTGVATNANLESITAVVLGGTSLFGGRGNVLGTLIGALIVSVFRNGLLLMGFSSVYQTLS